MFYARTDCDNFYKQIQKTLALWFQNTTITNSATNFQQIQHRGKGDMHEGETWHRLFCKRRKLLTSSQNLLMQHNSQKNAFTETRKWKMQLFKSNSTYHCSLNNLGILYKDNPSLPGKHLEGQNKNLIYKQKDKTCLGKTMKKDIQIRRFCRCGGAGYPYYHIAPLTSGKLTLS